MIEAGKSYYVKRNVTVGGRLAFRQGEIIIVEAVKPHRESPDHRYLTYSKRLGKYYLLSENEIAEPRSFSEETAGGPFHPSRVDTGQRRESEKEKHPETTGGKELTTISMPGESAITGMRDAEALKPPQTVRKEKGEPVPRAVHKPTPPSSKKRVVVAAVVFIVLLVAGIAYLTTDKKASKETGFPAGGTNSAIELSSDNEPEELTFDDLVSIANVSEGQEVFVGTIIVSGKCREGVFLTLNDAPVGILPETGEFHHPVNITEGDNMLTFVATRKGKSVSKALTLTGILTPEAFKASCPEGPPYSHLNKNPEACAGTRCRYKGKVAQVMESGGSGMMRIDVTNKGYGFWTDTIYVTYTGTTPAVEGSIVVVYGTLRGSHTYESVAGWMITLPWIEAKYVDVVG